tara:strand:- start:469 stop:699 length:231 start_codon:yes stop_codon:yes gene_type:complete
MALIVHLERGKCEDKWCDDPELIDIITPVSYIDSNKGPAKICQECLERWMDEQDCLDDNAGDMAEAGENTGYVFLP